MSISIEERSKVVAMLRIRNEARFIRRCLESIFEVCKTIVIWDDGSADRTERICIAVATKIDELEGDIPEGFRVNFDLKNTTWGWIARSADGERVLHFIRSPYTKTEPGREKQRVNEVRDKNALWYYVRALSFDFCLCMDGDEWLSKRLIREWPECLSLMEQNEVLDFGFQYLWDGENQIRRDGVYGVNADGISRLRFPRMFSVKNITEEVLFTMHFRNETAAGGFHCGSFPQVGFFLVYGNGLRRATFPAPIVHGGYVDDAIRQRKFEFYNRIDPNNQTEGGYLHIIGQRNCHQPGDVIVEPWEDR